MDKIEHCQQCGCTVFAVSRDMKSTRICSKCGHTWLPSEAVFGDSIIGFPDCPESVNHPKHYNNHPSGIECIQVIEHMGFNLGNAVKYIWRCDLKRDAIEDLKKAVWYLQREIEKREKEKSNESSSK